MSDAAKFARSKIAAFSLRHSKALVLTFTGLCLWGVFSMFTLPSGIYPDVAFARIVVIAERGEESVENMLISVTRPIEESINAVPGLARLRSKTIRGATELSLDFVPGTDMENALSRTRMRVAGVTSNLENLELTVEQQTPSVFPVISLNASLNSARTQLPVNTIAALNDWVQLNLKPRLARLPDAYQVSVQASDTRQLTVEADPERLAAAKLTLDDLAKAIRESNVVGAVGLLERDRRQFQLLVSGELKSANALEDLAVAQCGGSPVLLRQLAKVRLDTADRTTIVTGDGRDTVVISLFMRYGGKITTLSDSLKASIEEIRPLLPPGVDLRLVYDQAQLVHESLAGVRDSIIIGIVLATCVLLLFLGSWRLTAFAALAIPISVLGTFALMTLTHESLNLMSLGGVAVAIGLIIDDAIVVVENIARRIGDFPNRAQAVIAATGEITGAVVGSSLTTVVVFVPLVLLEGIVGQFFSSFARALASGILVSMVVSLTLVPILAAGKWGPRANQRTGRKWVQRLAGFYGRYIAKLLRQPVLWGIALIVLLLVAALGVRHMPSGFLPEMDEGGVVLDYHMPVGTSLHETDAYCQKIEAELARTAEVGAYSRRTGAELGFFATEQFTGDFLISFKPRKERERDSEEIVADLRQRLARTVPQIEVSFVQIMQDTINDLAGNPAPLEVKVFGNDYHRIDGVASRIAPAMEKIPGIVDVTSGVSYGSPEITYEIDSIATQRAGLSVTSIKDQMRGALLGIEASKLRLGERLLPIMVRYPDAYRHDLEWLRRLPIAGNNGIAMPASSVARISEQLSANELARENQQPLVSIDANISGIDLGTAASRLKNMLAKIPHGPDIRIEIGGQVQSQKDAFRRLIVILLLGIGLIWLLLVIQFRSYRLPLIIFLTLPPSQIGALWALRLAGIPLNISAFMGLIMLIGLVVKNGIIFIEYAAQLREQGTETLTEALIHAGQTRLRPILMTSLAAIIALLPLALNLGAGAELQRPLAVAVIGGLSISTLFTLIIIPVAHLLLGEPPQHVEVSGE